MDSIAIWWYSAKNMVWLNGLGQCYATLNSKTKRIVQTYNCFPIIWKCSVLFNCYKILPVPTADIVTFILLLLSIYTFFSFIAVLGKCAHQTKTKTQTIVQLNGKLVELCKALKCINLMVGRLVKVWPKIAIPQPCIIYTYSNDAYNFDFRDLGFGIEMFLLTKIYCHCHHRELIRK